MNHQAGSLQGREISVLAFLAFGFVTSTGLYIPRDLPNSCQDVRGHNERLLGQGHLLGS